MSSTNQFDNNGHASARQSARSAVQPGRGAAPTVSASGSISTASGHHQPQAVTPQTASVPTTAPASSRHYRPQAYYDTPAPAATAQQTSSSASSQQYYRQAQQRQSAPAPTNPSASNHPKGPAVWQANERHLRDVFRLNEVHLRNLPNLPPFNGDTRQGLPFDLQHITMLAIHSDSRQCLSLQDIYKAIETRYPDITARKPAWKESIRHRLSFKTRFCKIDRPVTHQGRGGYWYFDCTLPDDTKRPHRRGGAGDADAGSGSEDGSEGSTGASMTSTRAQTGTPASQTAYSSNSSSSSNSSTGTGTGVGGMLSPSSSMVSMSSGQYMPAGMNQPYGSYPIQQQQQQQQQMAYGAYMVPAGSPSMVSTGAPASGQWTTSSMSTPGTSSVGGYQAYSSVSPLSASQTSMSSSSSNGSRSSRGSGSSHGSQMSSYSHHHYRGQ